MAEKDSKLSISTKKESDIKRRLKNIKRKLRKIGVEPSSNNYEYLKSQYTKNLFKQFRKAKFILTGSESNSELEEIKSIAKSRRYQVKGKNINYHFTRCPDCNSNVKLLWVPKERKEIRPKCEKCIKKFLRENPDNKLKYDIYFLPNVISRRKSETWAIHEGFSKNHYAIMRYIEYCLDPKTCPEEIKASLTKDFSVLSTLIDKLTKITDKEEQKDINILKKQIKELFGPQLKGVTKVPWKILPEGEYPFDKIKSHYENLQKKIVNGRYDINRLEFISSLKPDRIYIGQDEFEGYIVFSFTKNGCFVLDCPIIGNAIYVMFKDWKTLSKLSKAELIKSKKPSIKRIIHRGDWEKRLLAMI